MRNIRFLFVTLIAVVAISGVSQGLTLPLLSVLLEKAGYNPVVNGLNSAAMYIGIIVISPFAAWPARRFGYRTTIIAGLALMTAATIALPFLQNVWAWFLMRFLLGIGDVLVHYSSQTWITEMAPAGKRGRLLSLYGFAYGAGFSLGPLGMLLLPLGMRVPFLVLCLLYGTGFIGLLRIGNRFPLSSSDAKGERSNRWFSVYRLGWYALLPSLLYGFLEASLNASFPVYAVRSGMAVEQVAWILPVFVIGSLLFQLPLGAWSDRFGRKKVLMACALIAGCAFCTVPLANGNIAAIGAILLIGGATVGSFYSLGLAFAADVLPLRLTSQVTILMSMQYSTASVVAPNVNGWLMDRMGGAWMFVVLGCLMIGFCAAGFAWKRGRHDAEAELYSGSDLAAHEA